MQISLKAELGIPWNKHHMNTHQENDNYLTWQCNNKRQGGILSYLVSYYYNVRSDDVKVLKSRWNFVKAKTTTPGNNIYT